MIKKLIINADDYGICREVNAAVENLVTAGKLHDVSVLVNSLFCEEAIDFLLKNRQCSVGVHLNVVEGVAVLPTEKSKAILGNYGQFIELKQLLLRWTYTPFAVSKAVEMEWRAQIELLLKAGLKISHADSHQHIHAFPPFWKILNKLCREYQIPALRLPRERNKIRRRRVASFALIQSANVSRTLIPHGNLASNHHFLGFKRAGFYGEDELIEDVKNLKTGVTELALHPSLYDGVPYSELRGALEYEALLSSNLWKQIDESKIELTTWTKYSAELSRN